MKRLYSLAAFLVLIGCRAPVAPTTSRTDAVQRAFQLELIGDTERAIDEALSAIAEDRDPNALVTQAALELLIRRATAPLGPLEEVSLASRSTRSLADSIEKLLVASTGDKRMCLALALLQLSGKTNGASDLRSYVKCLDQVVLEGPMSSTQGPESLANLGDGIFSSDVARVQNRGCDLALNGSSARTGSRRIVGRYYASHPGTLRVAWSATNAAKLRINGEVVSTRAFSSGPGATFNVFAAPVSSGSIDVQVGAWMGVASDKVSVFAWLDDQPLASAGAEDGAPRSQLGAMLPSGARTCVDDACLALQAGALALRGDARAVQAFLGDRVSSARDVSPVLALAYVRALRLSRDLPKGEMLRKVSAIVADVHEREPRSWEAVATAAAVTYETKGGAQGCRAALADATVDKLTPPGSALVKLIGSSCWLTMGQPGEAQKAIDAQPAATIVFKVAQAQSFPAAPLEQEARVCAARGNEACANVQRLAGRLEEARKSLERERVRKHAPVAFAGQIAELDCLRGKGSDVKWETLLSGERSIALASCLGARVASVAMPDVPHLLILHGLGDSPLPFDGLAEKALSTSIAKVGEATVVVEHQERYVIAGRILGFEIFDLRRLGGTTDVEQNAQADVPIIDGIVSSRTVRRRIFKRDGRVIEPNRTPEAAQAGADLVQLEAGDSVESIIVGYAVPDARGYLAFDTPELLAERTRVDHARIEIHVPSTFRLRAHPLLGAARQIVAGDPSCTPNTMSSGSICDLSTQNVVYEAHSLGPRNIEWRGLLLDRPVSVLATNDTWRGVGSRLASALVALDDKGDVEISALVAASGALKSKANLEAVRALVKHVGDRLRVSSPWLLADSGFVRTEGTLAQSARSMLLAREGSRTWVIHRALRELGIASEVVVGEPEPVSVDKDPIVHPGRFMHPLLRATIDGKQVFIDADVSGAPLPLGQVMPELVGRPILHADGRIELLSRDWVKIDRDEVHLKLRLLANGDAEGEVHLQVGGPPAQELDEALQRAVGEPRAYLLRSIVSSWVPGADVVSVNTSRDGDRIVVRASVVAARYAEREGDSGRLRIPGLVPFHRASPVNASTMIRTFGARSDRSTALVIHDALQYHVVRDIELPASLTIGKQVDDEELREDHVVAVRRATHDAHAVHDELTFELRPKVITPDQFATFLALSRRVDELFLASHVVLPLAAKTH